MSKATNTEAPDVALLTKLLRATKAVQPVKKSGDAGDYRYTKAEDIVREAERVLTARKVLVIPSVNDVAWKFSKSAALATVTMAFRVVDAETGASFTETWAGAGYDSDCDKALYQAKTGAAKYFYSQLLKIPIADQDPEFDGQAPEPELPEADQARREQDRAAEEPDIPPASASDLLAPDMEGLSVVA